MKTEPKSCDLAPYHKLTLSGTNVEKKQDSLFIQMFFSEGLNGR